MKIQFQNADGSHYAGMPQTERRGDKRFLRFAYAGCTGYLLLRAPLEQPIDLLEETTQHAIAALGDRLRFGLEEQLPGLEQTTVRYVAHEELYRSNDCVEIPDGAANYAVCGVWETAEALRILLPLEGMASTASVAVELHYSVKPHMIQVKKGIFRTVTEQSDFYQVTFERKNGYTSGMVYYTIGNSGLRYPVMEKMIGATTLIKTNKQIPEFRSVTPGVTLIKK